jgi:hypothetical protein
MRKLRRDQDTKLSFDFVCLDARGDAFKLELRTKYLSCASIGEGLEQDPIRVAAFHECRLTSALSGPREALTTRRRRDNLLRACGALA